MHANAIVTICDSLYLTKAICMIRSNQKYAQKKIDYFIYLFDSWNDYELKILDENINIISLNSSIIDEKKYFNMLSKYNVPELATAVKPYVLNHLISQYDFVTYLDPDILFFSEFCIEDYISIAESHVAALTPHFFNVIPDDKFGIDLGTVNNAGLFNLGYITVGKNSHTFLDWWSERTYQECFETKRKGIFTDQKWIDYAIAKFSFYIDRRYGVNVAYWNLHEREITMKTGTPVVNNERLIFFHYSGFDEQKKYLLSKHQGENPRHLLSKNSTIQILTERYASELEKVKKSTFYYKIDYDSTFELQRKRFDLHKVEKSFFDLARTMVLNKIADLPFSHENYEYEKIFETWSLLVENSIAFIETFLKLYPDLEVASKESQDPIKFLFDWAKDAQNREIRARFFLHVQKNNTVYEPPYDECAKNFTNRISLIGNYNDTTAITEIVENMSAVLDNNNIRYQNINLNLPNQLINLEGISKQYQKPINIWSINFDQFQDEYIKLPSYAKFYNIILPHWEINYPNQNWEKSIKEVDEIWCTSTFIQSVFNKYLKNTKLIPLPIFDDTGIELMKIDKNKSLRRPFIFLFSFDARSEFSRKNPIGVIEAFSRAFPQNANVSLILKVRNSGKKIKEVEKLKYRARNMNNITILEKELGYAENEMLLDQADCFVSLHRSEGLGLNLIKAMAKAKPTIATMFSGNLDYMNEKNSFLVDYTPVKVADSEDYEEIGPYPPEGVWAEPNIVDAAEKMKEVFENSREVNQKSIQGQLDVVQKYSHQKFINFLKENKIRV